MSANLQTGVRGEEAHSLRVQVVFHLADDRQAQSVAAQMIDRAHEIANLPECECDLDVSVELAGSQDARGRSEPGGAPGRPGPVKH